MPGIDQLISDRMNAFAGQPQALAQRYAQNQDLLDLLALQKMKSDKASAMRNVQASMQANPTTVRDQLEQEALTQTRQEMATQAMQGAQGMQLNQRRAMQARGIPTLPAPNMARMQRYQAGGIVPAESKPAPTMGAVPPSAVGDEQIKQFAKEYMAIKRALEDPRQAEYKERNQLLLQDLIRQMGNEMPAVMQYIDSTKGMVEPRGFQDGGLVSDALSYLAEQGLDAAQYTAEQLVDLGRQIQATGNRPSIEAMGAREAQLESRRRGPMQALAEGEGTQQIISGVERAVDLGQQLAERERNQRDLPSIVDEQGNVLSQVLSGAAQAAGDRMPNIVESMAEIGRNMPGTDLGQSPRLRLGTQDPTGGESTGGRSGRARERSTELPEFLQSGEYDPGSRRRARRERTPLEDAPRMGNEELAELVGYGQGEDKESAGIGRLLLGEPGGPGVPPSRRRMALGALWRGLTAPSEAANDLVNQLSARGAPTPEATPATTPAPAPIREPAGLGALVDRTTAMPEQFRMEGTEPSGMRTPQDYLASLARQQARRREETQEGAERPRSRYEEELDRLREEEGDLLGKITAMAQGIASGRGRSLGQSLAAGSAALTARERDIENRRLNLVEALQNAEITAEEAAREQRLLDIRAEELQIQRKYNDARIAAQQRVDAFAARGDIQSARFEALKYAKELPRDTFFLDQIRTTVEGSEEARGLSKSELDNLVQEKAVKEANRLAAELLEQSGLPELEAAAQRLTPSVSADQFAADMQITE